MLRKFTVMVSSVGRKTDGRMTANVASTQWYGETKMHMAPHLYGTTLHPQGTTLQVGGASGFSSQLMIQASTQLYVWRGLW